MAGDDADVLDVFRLTVSYRNGAGWRRAVEDVSFQIRRGEVLGLVGESGCGKSTVALQLLGFRHGSLRVDSGTIRVAGTDMLGLGRAGLDRMRGGTVSFVPQNPTTALNPGIRIGAQIDEILRAHRPDAAAARALRVAELMSLVGLPGDRATLRKYPHQLSGGQQQRVCIAMALACEPQLVVLDEPTTGLDVTTQEQIVDLLIGLRARLAMSMLYVTHDLGLLSQIADRIGVMYAGRMVEVAPAGELFAAPRHPYTQGLIGAIPRIEAGSPAGVRPLRGLLQRDGLPPGCPFAPRCDHALPRCFADVQHLSLLEPGHAVACWRAGEIAPVPAQDGTPPARVNAGARPLLEIAGLSVSYGRGARRFAALKDVTLTVKHGQTLALVGESGSGKSTLARAVVGLAAPEAGVIRLDGATLCGPAAGRGSVERRLIQLVFQNPDASLNPRATVAATLTRAFSHFFPDRAGSARAEVEAALASVRLDARYAQRYPDQLSGGERQRVAIARALIAAPQLLLCDEILSALDVSVQASILDLLRRLRAERGIAMLFISHDLAVVRLLADRVAVLYRGQVVEEGSTAEVFAPPHHPYTHDLLQAVPQPGKPRRALRQRNTAAEAATPGCAYTDRCAWRIDRLCSTTPPPLQQAGGGLTIRCHHSPHDLARHAKQGSPSP